MVTAAQFPVMVFDLLTQNLLSPVVLAFVLAFVLGIIARLIRSDLDIPSAIYQDLSIYLLFAIGLKRGGAFEDSGF